MILRLLVAAGFVAALQLTVIGICGKSEFDPTHLPVVGPGSLPENIGDFTGHDEPVDEQVLATTAADAMLNRVYRNRLGDAVFVNLGIWTRYQMGIPHSPELCYPCAGWEVVDHQQIEVPIDGQEPIRIKQFIFQRGTSRIAVAFWAQINNHIVTSTDEIRKLRQTARLSGEVVGPLVKVMLHTDAGNVEQAAARLSRFVAALAPHTRSIR